MTASSFTAPEPKAPRKRKPKAATAPEPQPVAQPVAKAQPERQRRSRGITIAPKDTAKACRAGTKQAILVDMLFRSGGASMAELREALAPWKDITIKSGLTWDMGALKGYGIRTSKRGDVDCYHLVLPAGMAAPVPHTPRASSPTMADKLNHLCFGDALPGEVAA